MPGQGIDPGFNRQQPPHPQGGGGQPGYNLDSFRVGKGGQMSVGLKGGGRSWLGQAETDEGSLVPMGKADNGYMQFGRVPIGNYTNQDPNSQGTPFALEGGKRAGFADDFGWNAIGGKNNKAWQNMYNTGGYKTYGQATGAFAANPETGWEGIQAYGATPDPNAGRLRRRNSTFGGPIY